jgi:hypothetical protein
MGTSRLNADAIAEDLRHLADLPVPVQAWQVEVGPDATDDLAVWVWATLADQDFKDPADTLRLRERIWTAIRERHEDADPWVYVRFRALSEAPPL